MSTIYNVKLVCGCCGKEFKTRELRSTNAIGYCDLDFRPPEMKRSTMRYWVQECPVCGYVSANIIEPVSGMEELLGSSRYRKCESLFPKTVLARKFVRWGILSERFLEGEDLDYRRMQAYLYAAWACDDSGEHDTAKKLRERAAKHLEKCDPFSQEELTLLLCDLYRRSEQYDKVIRLAEEHTLTDPELQTALQFEKERALEQDWDRYRFAKSGVEHLTVIDESDDDFLKLDAETIKAIEDYVAQLKAERSHILDEDDEE